MLEIATAFFKTGFGTAFNLLLNTVTLKILAVVSGPSGVGLLSLLRQIRQTALTIATLNGGAALVQGASSHQGHERRTYLATVLLVFLAGSGIALGFLTLFAPWIAQRVMGKNDPVTVSLVRWVTIPVFLNVLLQFANGLLNTFRAIGRLALVQVVSALTLAILAYPIARAVENGYVFAFIGMMSASAAAGLVWALVSAWRSRWLFPVLHELKYGYHRASVRHFFSIAGTMVVTGFVTSGTLLAVRAMVVQHSGLEGSGLFDAAWMLSMKYVMLILTSFRTYYLPTLSQTKDQQKRVILMKRLLRLSTLLMVPIVTMVIVLKPLVINLLYSDEFVSSLTIMRWMLIGDYFKVTSWILAMPMIAYADMKTFFWTEVVWNGLSLVFNWMMLAELNSLQGVGVTFTLTYITYLMYTLYYVRSRHQFSLDRKLAFAWLLGLVLLLGASLQTWSDTIVNWMTSSLWIGAALMFSWLVLEHKERRRLIGFVKVAFQSRTFSR